MSRILTTSILLAAALALSGCGTNTPKGFICPASAALVDAGSLTMLKPGDPSTALFKVDITKVHTGCEYDPETRQIRSDIEIQFAATRTSGSEASSYLVPYFIGISVDGATVVEKRVFNTNLAFESGQASTTFEAHVDPFVFVPAGDKRATDYELLIGIQLTKEQLDYNRRVGRFPQ